MSGFKINRFLGVRPRIPESVLPEHHATLAQNCDFAYAELRNTKNGFLIGTMSNSPKSIYTEEGLTFYTWDTDVTAVRSPMASDSFNRMYFTGDGGFKVANRLGTRVNGGPPSTSYLVGVPRPTVAPALSAPAHVDPNNVATWAYVYTYANIYNEEGPPSDATQITADIVANINVTATKDNLSGYVPLKEIRVYRTPTESTIADYFYVGKVDIQAAAVGSIAFVDNVDEAMLNETLSSLNNYPPAQDLVGLMSLPNGILCAWRNNELHFSEAYKPWAWPPSYVKTTTNNIVGAIVHGSGAFVTTLTSPYMVYGVTPSAMAASRINVDQAGVSKWAIAVVDGVVIYASPDGLVTLNGAAASLEQGSRFFTRDVWRQAYAAGFSKMRFSVWDGRLIVFASDGSFVPFMIRTDEADGTMTTLPGFSASSAFISQLSDQCYYTNGTSLYQFNGGTDSQAVWQSRELVVGRPTNFGFAQAVVNGDWAIEFYAGGTLRHTENVSTGVTNFRLPGGFLEDRWKVKVTGSGRFRELRVSTTAMGLVSL